METSTLLSVQKREGEKERVRRKETEEKEGKRETERHKEKERNEGSKKKRKRMKGNPSLKTGAFSPQN